MRKRSRYVVMLAATVSAVAVVSFWAAAQQHPEMPTPQREPDPPQDPAEAAQQRESRRAFAIVAQVLRHPRCLNCHPSGDRPRIGEDRQLHRMNVQRGPDDHGMPGLNCTACHQPANQEYSGVPGAPHWALAPRSMGWEGLDDHDLAEALKDRETNGDRSLDEMLHHMAEDPLVGWGWEPGGDREPVPISRKEFVQAFKTWIETGAVSPIPGTTTY